MSVARHTIVQPTQIYGYFLKRIEIWEPFHFIFDNLYIQPKKPRSCQIYSVQFFIPFSFKSHGYSKTYFNKCAADISQRQIIQQKRTLSLWKAERISSYYDEIFFEDSVSYLGFWVNYIELRVNKIKDKIHIMILPLM